VGEGVEEVESKERMRKEKEGDGKEAGKSIASVSLWSSLMW
jgi:hypothetical protein